MSLLTLTRVVHFTAWHHYRIAGWTDAENAEVFGDTRLPHAHDWSVEVTVTGKADPETGFVVDLPRLDELLHAEVVERFDGRDLNDAIPEVRDGKMTPSTESLAIWIADRLASRIPPPAVLSGVRVRESDLLWSEIRFP